MIWTSVTAAIAFVAFIKLCQFYWSLLSLPSGPIPLPFIGNLIQLLPLRGLHAHLALQQLAKKYGSVFTLHFGTKVAIVISEPKLIVSEMKKPSFAGRPDFLFPDVLIRPDSTDIIFGDYSKEWEALRKVGHCAARKFAVSKELPLIVDQVVDDVINKFYCNDDGSSVGCEEMISLLMTAISARAAFGKSYSFDEKEFVDWAEASDYINANVKLQQTLAIITPLKLLYWSKWKKFQRYADWMNDYIDKMFETAVANHDDADKNGNSGTKGIKSFCDAVIAAKNEAELEENWLLPYLKQQNLCNIVHNLFQAGGDTTKSTVKWIFLLLAKYPHIQQKLRQEVEQVVGSEEMVNLVDHKNECHYVNAFIAETLRFRGIVSLGLPHKALVDTKICGLEVKKGSILIFPLHFALHDKETWIDPENFRPERFLSPDGKFVSKPNEMFTPFGDGSRRSCPGNKLAFNNIFLLLTKFIQRTKVIDVEDIESIDLNGDPSATFWEPHNYNIKIVKKANK